MWSTPTIHSLFQIQPCICSRLLMAFGILLLTPESREYHIIIKTSRDPNGAESRSLG